jgi:hypothetical protein
VIILTAGLKSKWYHEINSIYYIFKLETPNKNYILKNESIYPCTQFPNLLLLHVQQCYVPENSVDKKQSLLLFAELGYDNDLRHSSLYRKER